MIRYASMVCSDKQPIDLVLLDIEPCMEKLEGVVMEINDSAYPLVKSRNGLFY